MLSKSLLFRLIRFIYLFLGRKFLRKNYSKVVFLNKSIKVEGQKKEFNLKIFYFRLLSKRDKFLTNLFFNNPLLLLLNNKGLLLFFINFKQIYNVKIFNFFLEKIKDLNISKELKSFIIRKIILKKNRLFFRLVFIFQYKNEINKINLVSNLSNLSNLFSNLKINLINSILNLRKNLSSKTFNNKYLLLLLKVLKNKFKTFNNNVYFIKYSKKKRYKFISLFF
jgi:hypothetical protein